MTPAPVSGYAREDFADVRAAFADSLSTGADLGANVAVFLNGELVVDIVGGHVDREKTAPWTDRHIVRVYSSGKAIIAMLAARAVSAGQLDYDAPVAQYWPEFSANGKAKITVADVLSHQAGLCALPDKMRSSDWLDWDLICARIAAMAPIAPPRSRSAYGPQVFGHVAGEILRRATGAGIREMLERDFRSVDGTEIYCGVPASEMTRVVPMQKPPRAPDYGEMNECTRLAFLAPWSAPSRLAPEALLQANIPASNIYANAKALAELVHPFTNAGRFREDQILSEKAIAEALQERIRSDDLVLPFDISWAAGVMGNTNGHFGPSRTAFGHAGWGGSAVMFDPAKGLSAAYVMNKMSHYLAGDPRAVRIFEATYETLGP